MAPERHKRSSSMAKGAPTRRFGAKPVEPHGLTWDKVRELGLSYIFAEPGGCNLTL
ncbi:hypothetical protein HAX54_013351, partial [Datura stramonium]|nr:hypothetical protein [Datura stramonium]